MNPNRRPACPALRRFGLVAVALLPLLAGCGSSNDEAKTNAQPASVNTLYNSGINALNDDSYDSAAKQFKALEQNYPYSPWAVKAQLMQGYAQYKNGDYTDAIGTLNRYIQLHPAGSDVAYAYYLRALCYYEQISDVERDQQDTREAMAALQDVINRFPGTAYARDAQLKIDLCRDHLAGKEMAIGRWYQGQHLYEAAIGRFQTVVNDYQTTNHVAEALARLTEIYLVLGLPDQAKKTAAVLGYNYPGSVWYQDTYNQLARDHLLAKGAPVPTGGGGGIFSRAFDWIF